MYMSLCRYRLPTHVPYEWSEVFIISHGDYHVPLLHLVDEGDSEEVGLDGEEVRGAGQDVHLSLRVWPSVKNHTPAQLHVHAHIYATLVSRSSATPLHFMEATSLEATAQW